MNEKLTKMANVIDFLVKVGSLKQLRRTGWLRHKIRDSESVADHMYRMGIMAFFIKLPEVDHSKCIKMALVHDLAESIIGDITPHCGISKEVKHEMEQKAMEELCTMAGGNVGKEIYALWEEYENHQTPEAKTVKQLDLFDMLMQAYEYEKQEDRPFHLQEFFNGTTEQITHPEVLKWLKELEARRGKLSEYITQQ